MTAPILRTSERGALGRCPQSWWWSWREGLVPKGRADLRLWFGQGVHVALAKWYCGPGLKRGPHPAETWERWCGEESEPVRVSGRTDEEEAQYVDAVDLGVAMLNGYVEEYGRDTYMHVIQAEKTFGIDVPWPEGRQDIWEIEHDAILCEYRGTYDLVYRDLRTDWVVLGEHKTAATIDLAHLPMDNQAGSYWAIATQSLRREGLIGEKESLRGIEYNFLRKGQPDPRPRDAEGYVTNVPRKEHYLDQLEPLMGYPIDPKLKIAELQSLASSLNLTVLGDRSKLQPPPLFKRVMVHRTAKERATQLRRIQDEAILAQAYREGRIPLTINPSRMNCMFCNHKTMCELRERGGNWEDFKRLNYNVVDPYADHRKSASSEA